jgi:hypothetical protein
MYTNNYLSQGCMTVCYIIYTQKYRLVQDVILLIVMYLPFLQENNQSIISFLLYQLLYYQIVHIKILSDLQLLLEGWTLSNA